MLPCARRLRYRIRPMVSNRNSGIWGGEWETLKPAGGGEKRLSGAAEETRREGWSHGHRLKHTMGKRISDQGAVRSLLTKRKEKTEKLRVEGNSLVVQWLGLCAFTAEGVGSIPSRGTKIL